jgi:hypothetical protein
MTSAYPVYDHLDSLTTWCSGYVEMVATYGAIGSSECPKQNDSR